MGFFDGLGKKILDAGQNTIEIGKEVADTAKINSMISEEEKKINSIYYQIGKLYASIHMYDGEEDFKGMLMAVQESEAKIAEYKKQIEDIKGIQHCPNCKSAVAKGVAFCSNCGTPMPKVETFNAEKYEKCANCGQIVEKGMRFCTVCGNPMVRMDSTIDVEQLEVIGEPMMRLCPICGSSVDIEAVFCAECGTKM